MPAPSQTHSHYFKPTEGLAEIDVYRVLELFNVTNPCIQHAVKKLLVSGGRGAGKSTEQDVKEATDSLLRYQQMRAEDAARTGNAPPALDGGIREEDVDVQTLRTSGGTSGFFPVALCGVRLTHRPTGTRVECDSEPSTYANRAKAFEQLKRLVAMSRFPWPLTT